MNLESHDLGMCERFKEIRTLLKMKQGDFAKEIKTTQGHVSDIENKRKGVSDRVIEIICLKFNVDEHWLRTGEGDNPFIALTRDEEISKFVGETLSDESDTFKKRFISMLSALSETDWETLEKIVNLLQKKED